MPVNTDVCTSFICKGFHTPFHVPVNSCCAEEPCTLLEDVNDSLPCSVELQWLEHLWNYENMFETGVVRAKEC